jgi:Protein of unknown function (DUF1189)
MKRLEAPPMKAPQRRRPGRRSFPAVAISRCECCGGKNLSPRATSDDTMQTSAPPAEKKAAAQCAERARLCASCSPGTKRKPKMERFSMLRAFILSFYSRDLYRDVAKKWKGPALGYLAALLALCWAARMLKVQAGVTHFANQDVEALAHQVPDISITNGQVSTNVETPHFIKDHNGTVIAIIDLTGQYTSLENTTAKLLLTRNHLVLANRGNIRTVDLKGVKSFHMDQTRAEKWLHFVQAWFAIILFLIALVFYFFYRTIQALIYALIGMLFASIMKVKLDYLTLYRLAIVAVTPAIIVDTLHSLWNIHTPFWSLICFLIAMAYLVFGIKANSGQQTETPEQPALQ